MACVSQKVEDGQQQHHGKIPWGKPNSCSGCHSSEMMNGVDDDMILKWNGKKMQTANKEY